MDTREGGREVVTPHTHTAHRTKMAHVELSRALQRFTKVAIGCYPLEFENRSRTTCSRFLQSFALPDEPVELQLS